MEVSNSNRMDILRDEVESLRTRLSESEFKLSEAREILAAIRSGDVDAVVVSGPDGPQIFTLQGAEYAYRALVEEMSEGAATLDTDGTILYCNRRLSDLIKTPMEQIIGSRVVGLFSKESQHLIDTFFTQARDGMESSGELELRTANEDFAPVHVSIRAMTSPEPITLCMVVTDLKGRKRNEELLAAGKLATSILESAAEGIAVCDRSGKIIKSNEAFDRLCDCNPVLQPFEKVMPIMPSGEAGEDFSIEKVLQGAVVRSLDVTLVRRDSQPSFLLLSASPIRDGSTVVGCVLTATDITERRRAQAAMLRTEKLASVGRMASTIAHEINNPLETIAQSVYLARTDPAIPKEAKSFLELAAAELERVAHITKQTLAFHRDNSTTKKIDLRELTDSVLKFFDQRLTVRGVKIEKRYDHVDCIEALGGEIRQVISNLISNSMDAVPNGGRILLRISRARRRDGAGLVRFVIADSGSGIERETMKTIFEPFITTKEVIGTGLGLWVTKQIVEKHRALIRVRSKPGAGTVFAIDFPVCGSVSPASR